ncbi:MAG: 30S ribosomal protein S8 [Candidatus Thorarchaeota archaeon]|jgi:ribosomal protein S8
MSQDIIADTLNQIMNARKAGKKSLEVKRYSKVLLNVLDVAKKHGYIEAYEIDEKNDFLGITIGELNKCFAIKPRYNVRVEDIEKYIRRFLPARGFGIIIISTSAGLLTHEEAYEKNIGGSLIAYFY